MAAVLEMVLTNGFFWDLFAFVTPLWVAVSVGLLVGWMWKPKWVEKVVAVGRGGRERRAGQIIQQQPVFDSSSSASSGSSIPQCSSCNSWVSEGTSEGSSSAVMDSSPEKDQSAVVNDSDFEHLWRLVEMRDGGPDWHEMMDRETPTMTYQAWRRDPQTGPPQYRSRTVYEDATPELVRDFFWDDEFRVKWDDMLANAATLEEWEDTGTMIVHWVRKFPFFCSDREYIIGRRIWQSGGSYYCVTKGVAYPSLPRRNKPRRVDLYYSSWCIRAVESRRGDGQLTACEVLLFHHEDMGIPWEIAKLGVRQGMWGAVRKIEPGLRAYQAARTRGEPLSRCAAMAQINTKVDPNYSRPMELVESSQLEVETPKKAWRINIPKYFIVGSAVVLACSLDQRLLTKATIFGVARRFSKIGGRRL
ncbi:uncharacterized protein LOC116258323 [Nymphaea colorata]|nr:uncharacterized protein LOC116258323 [Nymphaea colorata]